MRYGTYTPHVDEFDAASSGMRHPTGDSAIIGAGAGFSAGYLANAKPAKQAPQAREFWVFSVVLPFNGTAGIFPYLCTYHQPTMTGWLVVLDN